MAGFATYRVDGLREVLRVTDALPKTAQKEARNAVRKVAEPIRADAQAKFLTAISSDARKTRFGISVRRTGVVSVEQRVKSKKKNRKAKRPKFAELQMNKALIPAAVENTAAIDAAMNQVLTDLQRKWVRG